MAVHDEVGRVAGVGEAHEVLKGELLDVLVDDIEDHSEHPDRTIVVAGGMWDDTAADTPDEWRLSPQKVAALNTANMDCRVEAEACTLYEGMWVVVEASAGLADRRTYEEVVPLRRVKPLREGAGEEPGVGAAVDVAAAEGEVVKLLDPLNLLRRGRTNDELRRIELRV